MNKESFILYLKSEAESCTAFTDYCVNWLQQLQDRKQRPTGNIVEEIKENIEYSKRLRKHVLFILNKAETDDSAALVNAARGIFIRAVGDDNVVESKKVKSVVQELDKLIEAYYSEKGIPPILINL